MECRIGGILFSSNFDSGNLARVEKVSRYVDEPSSLALQLDLKQQQLIQKGINKFNSNINGNHAIAEVRADYEFRIWIRPDCSGTAYVNGNRTWFYFSVRGCSPGKTMRVTIMNMNKQSKIYSQGFSPIYRVSNPSVAQSGWQRIRDKPFWEIVNGQFLLTFIHRFQDPRGSITYFAFCYPWTYSEMQVQLNKLDSIFHYNKNENIKIDDESFSNKYNIMKLNKIKNNDKSESTCENVANVALNINNSTIMNSSISSTLTSSNPSASLSSSSSSSSLSSTLYDSKRLSENDLFDKIYFHRELLCYSLEGRRIELLTITDWSECTFVEEDRFDPLLFPDVNKPRPWKFTNKKVVVVSARVHPGETPSSHVFNGLLEFLLRVNDQRACELRKHYIFKLIPMLNPDGVFHGHYRTDTRGVNLNRVYLKPDFLYYPSIYAAKALIIYYHTNYGTLKSYAPFLDDIFRKELFTSNNYFETTTENATITDEDNKPHSNDKLSSSQSMLSCEITKQSKDEIPFDCETQEQLIGENKNHTITIQDQEKAKSDPNFISKNASIMLEQQLNNQNVTLTTSFASTALSSPTISNPPSKIAIDHSKRKDLSSKSVSSVEHRIINSDSRETNDNTLVIHQFNSSIADIDKNA
ncbi:unnamed protein product, partial [Schistosoma turkestanicum]